MSEMVYGPPFVIEGPRPEPQPYRLLDTAIRLSFDTPHWQNGVQLYPYSEDTPDASRPCLEGTFAVKETGTSPDLPIFGPFTPYIAETCSSMSIRNQEEFRDRARVVLDASISIPLERQLITGFYVPNNPYVGDSNVTILASGAPVTPIEGLALLEDAIAATGRMGIIHATPSVVTAWDGAGFDLVEDNGIIRTRRGTPIAIGGGYIGTKPDGTPALGADQQYAYATGPVQIMLDEIFMLPDNVTEALDREQNVVTYRAERTAVVDWDTQLQDAVLIDRNA